MAYNFDQQEPYVSAHEPVKPLFRQVSEPQPFPVLALGDLLGGAAKSLIRTSQAPDAIVGQSILAAASLAAQGLRDVEIDGRVYPTSTFHVTIGVTGERKTAVDKQVLKPHIDFESKQMKAYSADLKQFVVEAEAYKKAKSSALTPRQNGDAPAPKDLVDRIESLGAEPKGPINPTLIVGDPTHEGLTKLLDIGRPSVGIFSAEGGRLVGGHAFNKENQLKTLASFSDIWDGSAIDRCRAGDGTIKLYGRRVSMHLMIQPIVAKQLLSSEVAVGQGFLSRCLVVWPKSTMGTRFYVSEDLGEDPNFINYQKKMTRLLETALPCSSVARQELVPLRLKLTQEAHSLWVSYYNDFETELRENGRFQSISGFACKATEHLLRLAGIITVVENPDALTIGSEKLNMAYELICYYLNEAIRLNETGSLNPNLIDAHKTIKWIHLKGLRCIDLQTIYQFGPGIVREKGRASQIVNILEDHNYLIRREGLEVRGKIRREAWEVVYE